MMPMITRRHANADDENVENVSWMRMWMPETFGWTISFYYSKPALIVLEVLEVRTPQSNLQSTPPAKQGYAAMAKTRKKHSVKGAEIPDNESMRRRISAKNSSRVRLAFWVGDEDEVTVGGVRSIQASSSSNEGIDNLDPSSDTLRRGVTTFEWSIIGLGL